MLSLIRRWVRPRPDAPGLRVTIYTRDGCGCCHKALGLVNGYRRRHRFVVEEVDVDSDPALAAEHGLSVPVVAVNGKVRFKGVVNPDLFERLLRAEAASTG